MTRSPYGNYGHAILTAGVTPGRRIAALLNETLRVAEVYLAQAKIGAITAALNPYWPADTLRAVVEHSRCTAFVYDSTVERVVAEIRPSLPGVTTWIKVGGPDAGAVDLDALTATASAQSPPLGGFHDDPLALYYTSGTTGLPKAVVHPAHPTGSAPPATPPTSPDPSTSPGPPIFPGPPISPWDTDASPGPPWAAARSLPADGGFERLFEPAAVAVVGASTSRPNFGNMFLEFYKATGVSLVAVHPRAREVAGVPAVRSLAEAGVDYALVAVPAQGCAEVVRQAGGVAYVQVMSGGFGEAGRPELERELLAAARAAGTRLLGPNCMGVYCPRGRQTFVGGGPGAAGTVALISQSGGLVSRSRIWEAVAEQAGVALVNSQDELIGVLAYFQAHGSRAAAGDGTLVIGPSGGAGVLAADAFARAGVRLDPLPDAVLGELPHLGIQASGNPLEIPVGPRGRAELVREAIGGAVRGRPYRDVVAHVNVQSFFTYGTAAEPLLDYARALAGAQRELPTRITLVTRNGECAPAGVEDEIGAIMTAAGIPVYRSMEAAAVAVAAGGRCGTA